MRLASLPNTGFGQAQSSIKKLVEIAEQLCRLFLGDEMAAPLNPESPRSWRFALKIGLKPWISWSAEAQDGHRQGRISATIDNILWEGLIPTISSADSMSTGIGGSVNCAVSCVDRSLILQHISEEPLLLEARATLQELLRQSFHLVEREPPKIRMVLIDFVSECSDVRQMTQLQIPRGRMHDIQHDKLSHLVSVVGGHAERHHSADVVPTTSTFLYPS